MKFLSLIFIIFTCAFSFGKTGHRIVGKIAEMYLNPKAKAEIRKLIGHTNIAMVSNWADFIKSDSSWKHAWDWHFETVPDSLSIEESSGKYEGKLLEKIKEFRKTLADKTATKEDKVIALKFLVHLIGDLHQPLHVGNGKDRGGNSIKVEWFRNKTNLHRVWDSHMIDDQKMSYTEYANFLNDVTDKSEITRWISTNVVDWAKESKNLRDQVYSIGDGKLYYPYNFKNIKILEKKMMQAGVRLASVLNEAFKS